MLRFNRWAGVGVALWLFACANAQTQSQSQGQTESRSDVITEEEIVASSAANAYEVIRKLRANFLSFRGRVTVNGTASPDPTVYVDEQAYGGLASLRTIPAAQITRIRLYRSWEATTKYGASNMGGVIAVSTRQ